MLVSVVYGWERGEVPAADYADLRGSKLTGAPPIEAGKRPVCCQGFFLGFLVPVPLHPKRQERIGLFGVLGVSRIGMRSQDNYLARGSTSD